MKNLNLLKTGACCTVWLLLLCACNSKSKQAATNEKSTQQNATTLSPADQYNEVKTWLDDFKNFRTAVYQNDVSKIKTYFSFPVNTDTTQIWEAVYENVDEAKRPETFPNTFTEADFEKHYKKLFTNAFVKSILKVKSELLFKKGEYTTPMITSGKENFSMVANYDKATETLQLSVTYPGGTDEQGNYVSEGEYATIYFFKIESNRHLRFDKILFAG
ncbi:hypothetical protein KHS38_02585 [Mucilaginibacter sp. Bleaf8]|uniref:hypothetical protein n=1 Tax=Mucilaginibacter sp. Bleaf8 TaxID=2834430 RepID=UPI001BCAF994|nr:hypothetical protein [Mucilaginibacter sp. Bleaf8]MBS7563281.1 hypothetical protein [Mucilaginibacter sp. Bleaf8]